MVCSIKYLAEVCWVLVFGVFWFCFFYSEGGKVLAQVTGVVNAPSLETFRVRLGWALSSLS